MWVLSQYSNLKDIPMWVGYNSLTHEDNTCQQIVSYLTTIIASPTSIAVVKYTLDQCLQVADEIGDKYMQVSYDLGVEKIAMQVQSTERPTYDSIVIHLEQFHVMMAYFKGIGKFIENCGISNILVDSELIAHRCVGGLISGKSFNRCKYLFKLLCLAFEILRFERFLSDENIEISMNALDYCKNFMNERFKNPLISNHEVKELFKMYEQFQIKTLSGDLGKTAQFYSIFIQLVNYYLIHDTSVRKADFALLLYILPKISNIFFASNQQNYSRYLVKYHDNMLKIDSTHPGLREQINQGSFDVKRTNKVFSRQPVDLTLEQTINADTANKLTGIIHSSNSIAARQRWARTHTDKSAIVTHVYNECGLKKTQDITEDLKIHNVRSSHKQLETLMGLIRQNINPFSNDIDPNQLFNISTGAVASDDIDDFLLNIESKGEELQNKFIEECSINPDRFESPIQRVKTKIFVDLVCKKKKKIKTVTVRSLN